MVSSDAPSAEEEVVEASRRLGRYTLRYRIAQGGMASVYLAQLTSDVGFQKWVAIKMIHPHIASDPQFVQMFLNEARLAARLEHTNLCTVFDFGESAGRYYLAMEYLHGETLGQLSRRAWGGDGMPYALAARILADSARGLHSAHETRQENGANAGVVHRDVSPQNLFVLYTGVSKVVDFGIARSNDASGERTATGILKGKLAYMAPEQIQEQPVDRRTDLWALGVVLWETTTGERLFKRPNDATTLMAVLQDAVPAPSTVRSDFPAALEIIVLKALERDPARRYQTGLELARALEAWLATAGVPAGTDEVGELMHAHFTDRIAFRDQLLHPTSGGETVDVVAEWAAVGAESDLPPQEPYPPPSPRKGDRPRGTDLSPVLELSQVKALHRPLVVRDTGTVQGHHDGYTLGVPVQTDDPRRHPPTLEPLVRPSDVSGRHAARSQKPRNSKVAIATGVLLGVLLALGAGVFIAAPWRVPSVARLTPVIPVESVPVTQPAAPVVTPRSVAAHGAPPSRGVVPEVPRHGPVVPATTVPVTVPRTVPVTAPVKTVARVVRGPVTGLRPRGSDASVEDRPGYLNLTSEPPVEVFYGSQSLGISPIVDHSLPSGHQVLRLVPRDGTEPRSVTVDVHPGESVITSYNWH